MTLRKFSIVMNLLNAFLLWIGNTVSNGLQIYVDYSSEDGRIISNERLMSRDVDNDDIFLTLIRNEKEALLPGSR